MKSISDFITLVNDELGLPFTLEDAEQDLTLLPSWDSVHFLWLLTLLERTTGRSISFPDMLEATSLNDIYILAVGNS